MDPQGGPESTPSPDPSLAPSQTLVQDESRGVDHDAGVEHLRVEGAEQVRWARGGGGRGHPDCGRSQWQTEVLIGWDEAL